MTSCGTVACTEAIKLKAPRDHRGQCSNHPRRIEHSKFNLTHKSTWQTWNSWHKFSFHHNFRHPKRYLFATHWSMWLELPCYHWGVQQISQAVRRDHLIHHQRKEHVFLAGIVQINEDILWSSEEQTVQLHTHPKPHERQDRFWRLHKCTWNPCSFIPVRRITHFR